MSGYRLFLGLVGFVLEKVPVVLGEDARECVAQVGRLQRCMTTIK